MQLKLYFREVKSSLPNHLYSYLFQNKKAFPMQLNLKALKRKKKHPSKLWIYSVIFFLFQVYFLNQCVALKLQIEPETCDKKSESL